MNGTIQFARFACRGCPFVNRNVLNDTPTALDLKKLYVPPQAAEDLPPGFSKSYPQSMEHQQRPRLKPIIQSASVNGEARSIRRPKFKSVKWATDDAMLKVRIGTTSLL